MPLRVLRLPLILTLCSVYSSLHSFNELSAQPSTHLSDITPARVSAAALPVFTAPKENSDVRAIEAKDAKDADVASRIDREESTEPADSPAISSEHQQQADSISHDATTNSDDTDDANDGDSAVAASLFAYDTAHQLIDCTDPQLTIEESHRCNANQRQQQQQQQQKQPQPFDTPTVADSNDAADLNTLTNEAANQPLSKRDEFMWNLMHPIKSLRQHAQKSAATVRTSMIHQLRAVDPLEENNNHDPNSNNILLQTDDPQQPQDAMSQAHASLERQIDSHYAEDVPHVSGYNTQEIQQSVMQQRQQLHRSLNEPSIERQQEAHQHLVTEVQQGPSQSPIAQQNVQPIDDEMQSQNLHQTNTVDQNQHQPAVANCPNSVLHQSGSPQQSQQQQLQMQMRMQQSKSGFDRNDRRMLPNQDIVPNDFQEWLRQKQAKEEAQSHSRSVCVKNECLMAEDESQGLKTTEASIPDDQALNARQASGASSRAGHAAAIAVSIALLVCSMLV